MPIPASPRNRIARPVPVSLHLPPAIDQHRDFCVTPDDGRQTLLRCRFKAALGLADADHAIDLGKTADALQLLLAQILIFEFPARQAAHAVAHDDGARLGDGLKAGGEIHGFADRVSLAGGDNHHARGDADANLQPSGALDMQSRHGLDDIQPGADGAFSLGFVRQRKSEESDDAIAQRGKNIALVTIDAGRAGLLIGANDDLQRFGVELVGELGESDHVAEQHRELTALADRRLDMTPATADCAFSSFNRLSIRLRGPNGRPSSLRSLSVSMRSVARSTSFSSKTSMKRSRSWDFSHSEREARSFHDGAPPRFGCSTRMP